MRSAVTPKQKRLLEVIYDFIKHSGYPPTFEEMRRDLKVKSNQSVVDFLHKLEEKQIIKKNEAAARGLAILPLGYELLNRPPLVPFLGVTHAGAPIEAVAIEGEWQTLPGNAVAKLKEDVFLLKVSGDSMINAGIDDGDVVLVKNQKEFSHKDIVLAQVGEESTVKRFMSEDKPPYLYLKPENPAYSIIYFTEEVVLKGKIISILKQGQWKSIN